MTTKLITGPAGHIYIDDGGSGGIPIIFIHSFAGNTTHWSSQLMHLRSSRRAIAFDLRGHGNSDSPNNNDYSVKSLSHDLAAVVDALKLRKCVLVGHSIGGSVSIEYAGQHAERVEGVVLVETPGNIPSEQAAQILSWLESDYDSVIHTYWDKLLSRAQPQVSSQIRAEMGKFPRDVVMAIVRTAFDYNPLPALSSYPGPKLAVITSHNESPHDLHKLLPDLPFKTLTGTSHWIHMDRPADFNLLVDDFLSAIEMKKIHSTHAAEDERLLQLLERFGNALTTSNVKEISECWETPAVMLSDEGASVFGEKAKIEQMFLKAGKVYRAQGVISTRPEIERIERLSATLVEVDVRWPAFDAAGNEIASERSHYIVHFGKDGEPRIQVALSRDSRLLAA